MRGFLFSDVRIAYLLSPSASINLNLPLSNFSNFQGKFMGDHAYTETEMNLIEHETQNRDTLDECPA